MRDKLKTTGLPDETDVLASLFARADRLCGRKPAARPGAVSKAPARSSASRD